VFVIGILRSFKAPVNTKVSKDEFLFLTEKASYNLPIPKMIDNSSNYVISLGNLTRWLGEQAENLGVILLDINF
jgi:electron-transferring-flavoprotein dehydrogenase